jgi:hypothetical protein
MVMGEGARILSSRVQRFNGSVVHMFKSFSISNPSHIASPSHIQNPSKNIALST